MHEEPTVRGEAVLLLIGAVTALVAVLYAETFGTMASMWRDSTYNHGAIVFPVAAYLLWRERAALAKLEPSPWKWGIGLLGALTLVWLFARALGVQNVEQVVAVAMIPASVATFIGTDAFRRALFPLLFLFAAVPFGESLTPYLMRITADLSSVLLRMSGVPVYREGQFLTLPGGVFEVADVCSGLRYLTSGLIVGLLFAYLTYRQVWRRVLFVGMTGITFILVNGVRAYVIMVVASATDMRWLAGRDHVYFGWLLFAAAVAALFWLGFAIRERAPESPSGGGTEQTQARASGPLTLMLVLVLLATTARPFWEDLAGLSFLLLPVGAVLVWWLARTVRASRGTAGHVALARNPRPRAGSVAVVCVAAVVLASGPVLLTATMSAKPSRRYTAVLPAIPACQTGGWALTWQPEFIAPDYSASATYRCSEGAVSAFVAGYDHDVQGRELVSETNRLIPDRWRSQVAVSEASFLTVEGRKLRVKEVRVEGTPSPSLVWYWYSVGDRTATNEFEVKLLQALELVKRGRSGGTVYLLETSLDDLHASRERLVLAARSLADAPLPIELGSGDQT